MIPIIVIEGPDGVGKSTVARILASKLRGSHLFAHAAPWSRDPYGMALEFATQRAKLVHSDAVRHARVIIADRWYWSTVARSCAVTDYATKYGMATVVAAERTALPASRSILLTAPGRVLDARIMERDGRAPTRAEIDARDWYAEQSRIFPRGVSSFDAWVDCGEASAESVADRVELTARKMLRAMVSQAKKAEKVKGMEVPGGR